MKKFMVSVADVRIYDVDNDDLIAIGKTLVDSSLEMTLGNTDIRGGRGNQLQAIYYHTSDLNITVNDTQFNLEFLAATVGKDIVTGTDVYTEETVTLGGGGGGTITGTPLAVAGTTVYGWVSLVGGGVEKVTFTGSAFTASLGTSGDVVCVRYFHADAAARSLTIGADVLPSIVRVEMETLLISSQETTNRIGVMQIIVPTATLSGAFSLSMTSDGVSTTPLMVRALANDSLTSAACLNVPVLAEMIEILDEGNWYDSVIGLSIQGGDFTIASGTRQLIVWAVPSSGAAFIPPVADLTFASTVTADATVGLHTGLVTWISSGASVISVTITAKTAIDAAITVTTT